MFVVLIINTIAACNGKWIWFDVPLGNTVQNTPLRIQNVVSVFLLLKKGAGDSYEWCLTDVQRSAAGMSPLLCYIGVICIFIPSLHVNREEFTKMLNLCFYFFLPCPYFKQANYSFHFNCKQKHPDQLKRRIHAWEMHACCHMHNWNASKVC